MKCKGLALAGLLVSFPVVALADPPAASAPAPSAASNAAAAKPDVATLLFTTPQWGKAPAGAKLNYTYEKTTTDASLGNAFKDSVVLTLGAGDDADSRTVEMQLFSGANRRPAGPFRSDKQNPVTLVVLEESVQELSKLFKANPRYLKNAIRKAWRDNAKIEPIQVSVGGKTVPGTRIAISPFVGDAEADRMKGLDHMTIVIDVAEEVPGYIASIDIRSPETGKPLFEEALRYASETTP